MERVLRSGNRELSVRDKLLFVNVGIVLRLYTLNYKHSYSFLKANDQRWIRILLMEQETWGWICDYCTIYYSYM